MNVTLGSLRTRDLLALEDLDLLPEEVNLEKHISSDEDSTPSENIPGRSQHDGSALLPFSSDDGLLRTSRRGTSGGISWFEDMIEGSQLGHHSKKRKGHGQSLDGRTSIAWEVSEYYGRDEVDEGTKPGAKRKAGEIEADDTAMKD